MPVSTDGVLLGSWFSINTEKRTARILDIGTGTGLLALMCAQRFPCTEISAIEIDQEAVKAARINFEASRWSERIELLHQDVLTFFPSDLYDYIICNPPYFLSGEQSSNPRRATARHTDKLNHEELLRKCLTLLTVTGSAFFILPFTEGQQFIESANKQGWYLNSFCGVKPTENKAVSRILIELSPTNRPVVETELSIRSLKGYTKTFVELTKPFYLKM